MKDVTGWCTRGECASCSGRLNSATGHHWWCAHNCHDEPNTPRSADGRKALSVWRAARKQQETEQ